MSISQGGLTLAQVLRLLKQAVAGLLHLHSLGILHRDLRAANLLIDAIEPLRVLVADFGVSHLLSAFATDRPRPVGLTAGKAPTALWGTAALTPLQVGRGVKNVCVWVWVWVCVCGWVGVWGGGVVGVGGGVFACW